MVLKDVTLGELISTFYGEFLALYGDENLASMATAAAIDDLMREERYHEKQEKDGYVEPVQ